MAGKRPDQHNIAPGEAGSTDYKRYPEVKHGQGQDLSPRRDKQRLVQSEQAGRGQPFLPDVPSPSVHAKRGRKLEEAQPGAAETDTDADTDTGDPLA